MQNDINSNQIKYPFNGRSKYLIDKFCIMGFDPSSIENLVEESKISEKISEKKLYKTSTNALDKDKNYNIIPIKIQSSSPMLLSEMSSDYTKEIISFDIIKELIFPKGCQFFYELKDKNIEENRSERNSISTIGAATMNESNSNYRKNINKLNKLEPYFVTFSNNPQIENNSKKSINCFSYIFYKNQEINLNEGKTINFYFPFSFCIISEFQFYNSYFILCKQLYELFNKSTEIPLEVILYNIINFVPSPLNYAVTINLNIFYNSRNLKNKSTSEKNLPIVNKDIIPQRKEGRKLTKNSKKKLDNLLKEENNNMIVKPKNNFQDIKFEILS